MTKRLKSDKLRKFGLDLVGDVPWGTHLCQFYETKEDLIDILVPYFAEGLRNNEFCIWITSPPLEVEEAKVALKKAVPDLDQYIQKRQIEILPYTEWYLLGGEFDADRVLQGWVEKEKDALSRGLEGLRLTGSTFWIERSLWKSFTDYEAAINSVITSHRILTLCTYSLERCTSSDLIDVVRNHVGTLIRKEETWHLVEDVAQRKAAEEALYASLERYRSFIEVTGELGWTTNADGEVVEDISSFRNFTGQTFEEVKGWGWSKALHPDDLERTTRIWKEATRTRSNYEVEYRVRRYDGVYRYFLARGVPVFKEDGSMREWVGTCIDITNRKKAEEALAESERRYRSLFANMNSGFALCKIVSDNDGKPIDYIFLEVNDDFEKLTGLGKEAVLGKRVSEVLFSVEKNPADWIGICERVAATGEPARFESYFELLKKWLSVAAFSPELGYLAMAFDDITDRKKTEELYKQVVQTAIDGFWITDSTGRFLDVNNAYSKIIGYSREELLKMSVHDVETKETPEETAQHIQEIIQHGYGHFETCHRRKDGRIVDVEVSVTSMGQDDGRLFVFVHDITRRKRNEDAVRNLALFPEENPFPVLRVAHDGTLLYANHSSARLLELWGCKTGQLVPEQVRQRVALALDAQEIAQLEAACGLVTYSFSVAPIPSLGYANLYGTDITERKQTEQALLRAKNEWELTFNSVPDLIAILDDQHRIVRANRAMAQRLGVTPEQCIGKKCYECVHGSSLPPEFCPHAQTLKDGREHIAEVHEDRMGGDFLVSTTPLVDGQGRMVGSVHVARDITKLKQIEKALRESQHDLNHAQAVAKTGSWRLDTQRNELLWSDENHRIFGIPKGTPMTYETFLSTVHPDDRGYVDRKWKAGLRGEPYDIEHRIVVNGEVKWVRERAELEFNKDGVLLGGFGTTQDITERKEMEKELHESLRASQYRQSEVSALLKASRAVLQNRDFKISARAVFDACKELIGATAGYVALLSDDGKDNIVLFLESGGLPCSVDPSLPMPVRGLRAETYSTGKVAVENNFPKSEWSKLMPSGHAALENVLFAPLTVEGRTVGIIGLANKPGGFTKRDAHMALAFGEIASIALINSQMLEMLEENAKKLKIHSEHLEELVEEKTKQLRDTERLAAIGETAGMVGHDIRNPLQTIICELYLAKGELSSLPNGDSKETLKGTVRAIEDQVTYINKIVTDLQDYAKPLSPCYEETDLEKTLQSVLSVIFIPETIEVSSYVADDCPKLMTDPSYVKRMLTNLVSNAVQAMPNGGKLAITAHCKDNKVFLNVEDTGEGISEEAKSKLFKPLFTTKAKGQGFGLAVVKKLTDALGGNITFESEPGKGTKFIVELPIEPKTNGKTQKE